MGRCPEARPELAPFFEGLVEMEEMDDRLGQGAFRAHREATSSPVEIDVIAKAYLSECGAFAEDVGLRPEAASTDEAVVLLEVGGALGDGAVFLMPSEIPEVSDLPAAGGYALLGELPRDGAVMRRDIPPLRWSVPACPGVVTVVRVCVEGGVVESPGETAQQGSGAHC